MMKLQLVQPILFGDTILCYHRKIKQLILGRYCRYQRSRSGVRNVAFHAQFHGRPADFAEIPPDQELQDSIEQPAR